MEKYQLIEAESFNKDLIIKLNSENMPAVGDLMRNHLRCF